MVSIDDETADHGERFCVYVFSKDDVHPSHGTAVHVRDEELLVFADEDPRQPVGRVRVRQVVAESESLAEHHSGTWQPVALASGGDAIEEAFSTSPAEFNRAVVAYARSRLQ